MSSLTLTFRDPAEEVIVRRALVQAYARVLGSVEAIRQASNDAGELLALATVCDYAQERRERLHAGYVRACGRAGVVPVGHDDASPAPCAFESPPQPAHLDDEPPSAALPANPFLLCPDGQSLPTATERPNVNGAKGPEVHHAG